VRDGTTDETIKQPGADRYRSVGDMVPRERFRLGLVSSSGGSRRRVVCGRCGLLGDFNRFGLGDCGGSARSVALD
jgi:hypothetical protein